MERKIGGGGKGEGRGKEEEDEGNLKEKKEAKFRLIWPFGPLVLCVVLSGFCFLVIHVGD